MPMPRASYTRSMDPPPIRAMDPRRRFPKWSGRRRVGLHATALCASAALAIGAGQKLRL